MKLRIAAFLLVCSVALMGATCVDTATGTSVTKNPDGSTTVTQSPTSPVAVAGAVAGSLPIPFAGLIGAAITAIPGIWAAFRGKAWKQAAIATAQATGQIIGKLPPGPVQDAAIKVVDTVHDAHDVVESLQVNLQGHVAATAAAPTT
jgi:hypothetical protein